MKEKLIVAALIAGLGISGVHGAPQNGGKKTSGYSTALAEAVALDDSIRATRANYTKMVVQKLKSEGAGAALDYASKDGFVPLPAVLVRKIAFDIVRARRAAGDSDFSVALRSRWNLNTDQSLISEIEKEGWNYLVSQQEQHLSTGKSLKDLVWKPYVTVQEAPNGSSVLRYLSADAASAAACVSCHSSYEKTPDIQALRRRQNIEVGKQFERYELMGAISISIAIGQ